MAVATELGGWTVAMATQTEKIRCKADGCKQVIAERWRNGSVKSLTNDNYMDEYKHVVITCPACGLRNRIPIQKRKVN